MQDLNVHTRVCLPLLQMFWEGLSMMLNLYSDSQLMVNMLLCVVSLGLEPSEFHRHCLCHLGTCAS